MCWFPANLDGQLTWKGALFTRAYVLICKGLYYLVSNSYGSLHFLIFGQINESTNTWWPIESRIHEGSKNTWDQSRSSSRQGFKRMINAYFKIQDLIFSFYIKFIRTICFFFLAGRLQERPWECRCQEGCRTSIRYGLNLQWIHCKYQKSLHKSILLYCPCLKFLLICCNDSLIALPSSATRYTRWWRWPSVEDGGDQRMTRRAKVLTRIPPQRLTRLLNPRSSSLRKWGLRVILGVTKFLCHNCKKHTW